ncbi:hypothetical protein BC831DRAFT_481460 [Entophlyctis helioformis]|nr:hypothetical protein BC831DRAFT_481460 [Entophlyctis helioformis]
MSFLIDSAVSAFRSTLFTGMGLIDFTQAGFQRAARSFNPKALDVDLTGKVAIVTGANSGLGKETALGLAKLGATVLMVCRNPTTGEAARAELAASATSPSNVRLEVVDVSRPAQIQAFAEKFVREHKQLDILVNNAGVLLNERTETADGIETTFATNTLGVYYLTKLLLPRLTETPESRVINVSSGGMYTEQLSTKDLESKQGTYNGAFAYAQTKRAEIELATAWAQQTPGVRFYSMHPGWANTSGVQTSLPGFFKTMESRLRTAAEGADTIVWAAASREVLEQAPNGSFLFDRKVTSPHMSLAGTEAPPGEVAKLIDACEAYLARLQPSKP